jgi:hypothetical protein
MTHLRKIMLEELERRNYAETTKDCYIHAVALDLQHHRSICALEPLGNPERADLAHQSLDDRFLLCRPGALVLVHRKTQTSGAFFDVPARQAGFADHAVEDLKAAVESTVIVLLQVLVIFRPPDMLKLSSTSPVRPALQAVFGISRGLVSEAAPPRSGCRISGRVCPA